VKYLTASSCVVASGNPLAVEAARAILKRHGSAIDAAIAADIVMGVVEPMATSIGGDLLAMVVDPSGKAVSYNGTGRAPLAFADSLLDSFKNHQIPERHGLSITTPGVVMGWWDLHQRYGSIPWSDLFTSGIDIARHGFRVAAVAAREWKIFDPVLHKDPISSALFRAGNPPAVGELFRNPDLALVLEKIQQNGPQGFYQDFPARACVQASRRHGGVLHEVDFEQHHGNFCEPVSQYFKGITVHECPPNTHGVAVLQALGEMADLSLCDMSEASVALRSVQAMERGMDHAKKVVSDPAGNTVCTVVVDDNGLAVTLMSSVFKRFGSGISAEGCGFVLQNRGFGFAGPGHINCPAPGKRPFHTVVPAAATRDDQFFASFGVVGGAMQPQGQLQLLLKVVGAGQSIEDAIKAPRWRLESANILALEDGMPDDIVSALRAAGYQAPTFGELGGRSDFGGAQWIMRLSDGLYAGASDPRKDGAVWGE